MFIGLLANQTVISGKRLCDQNVMMKHTCTLIIRHYHVMFKFNIEVILALYIYLSLGLITLDDEFIGTGKWQCN